MPAADARRGGTVDSIRRMVASVLSLAHNRVELFAIEFKIEQQQMLALLLVMGIGLVLALIGLVLGTALVAFLLWEAGKVLLLAALAVLSVVAGGATLWLVSRRLRTGPKPFVETIAQFAKDRACLQKED